VANPDARLVAAIRRQPAHLRIPLLTTALIESGGQLRPRGGDGGTSFGPYQMHRGGRLTTAGYTPAQAEDPILATRATAREFGSFYDRGARGGSLAYRAQRPADQAGYLSKYAQYAPQAARILGQQGGAVTPRAPAGRRAGGATATGGGGQLTPDSVAAVQRYARQSEADVMAGRLPGDVAPVLGSLKRTGAPASAGRQVALDGLSQAGRPSDPSDSQVINAAKGVLGTPYSWGGGTPSGAGRGFGRGANTVGFDCSSLVQYAWAKVGVKLPRTTYDQIKTGTAVSSINQAQPGDLLFPSTGHVQMYVGNGKVIEAPRTGGHVQIVPARSSYIAIRRPG